MTPYVASYYSHTNGRSERTSNLGERIATIPTENRHALIAPVLTAAQQGGSVRRVDAPHHTITASNKEGTQISCRGSWAAADGQGKADLAAVTNRRERSRPRRMAALRSPSLRKTTILSLAMMRANRCRQSSAGSARRAQ